MSKTVALVGAAPALHQFATALLQKASKNTVTVAASAATTIVLGSQAGLPAATHTLLVKNNSKGLYNNAGTVLLRAALPPPPSGSEVALRDAVDVFPSAGVASEAEQELVAARYALTAKAAVQAAKDANVSTIVVAQKQQSKFQNNNELFVKAVRAAAEEAKLGVEIQSTAAVFNQIVLFPEHGRVVATSDTQTAEVLAEALGGLYETAQQGVTTDGSVVLAGHSFGTVGAACAEALRRLGLATEAKAIETAVAAKGKDAVAAL